MNMTRVYNNFYYAREKDSMDFLGHSDMVFDNKRKNFISSAEFKKRMTLLCEDLQGKVKADNINIYLIDDDTKDINLFLSTGNPIELCDYCKENILNINYSAENNDFNKIFKQCPKSCNLFNNEYNPNKCQVKIYPITYGSKLIGIMFVYYDEDKNLMFNGDVFIKSICYKFGLLCENQTIRTKLEKASNENQKNLTKLQLFMDNSHDFWVSITKDGRILSVSKNIIDTLGWTNNELVNMDYSQLLHPDDIQSICDYLYDIQKNNQHEGFNLMTRFRCKNGTYILIKWHWIYKADEDTVTLTGKDLTLQKKLEEENKKIHQELEKGLSKIEFFSNMSHEFRTPLNIILTSAQLMKIQLKNKELEKAERNLQYITQNSYRLIKLTNNILDVTKIDYGNYDLNLENCNIVEVIENIVTSVADYIKSFDKDIIFDTDEEEIITACDIDAIERIMLNLLSNALKYVHDKGTIKVNMSLDSNEHEVLISVWDDGISIKPENAEKIFERYNKIDNSLTRQCEGGGIGLSLTKSFVEMHKGRIWANTEVEKGAEIIFALPIKNVSKIHKPQIKSLDARIEKCNIELSDIYSLTR